MFSLVRPGLPQPRAGHQLAVEDVLDQNRVAASRSTVKLGRDQGGVTVIHESPRRHHLCEHRRFAGNHDRTGARRHQDQPAAPADPHGKPTIAWRRNTDTLTAASRLDGLYAIATTLPDPPERELTAADVLDIYKDQWIVEQRHRDLKQTLHVRPIFLHNDDRITALIAIVGIALLIYGLIEADLRQALGPDTSLPGILPENRHAVPTARAVLAAFTDLHATYTTNGLLLDRLTQAQRLILAHLDIPLPWPETNSTTTTFKNTDLATQLCGKRR